MKSEFSIKSKERLRDTLSQTLSVECNILFKGAKITPIMERQVLFEWLLQMFRHIKVIRTWRMQTRGKFSRAALKSFKMLSW